MPKRVSVLARSKLNPKLKFNERLALRRFTKKYPRTVEGVRIIVADLNKMLTEIGTGSKSERAREYDKSGEKTIMDKKIGVPFWRGNPMYGCHQLSKALTVALREMGIPARIVRLFPENESFVLFRLGKEDYEVFPFSGEIRKLTPSRRQFYRENLAQHTNIKPDLRLHGVKDYTFEEYESDKLIKKNLRESQI